MNIDLKALLHQILIDIIIIQIVLFEDLCDLDFVLGLQTLVLTQIVHAL